ncbi:MAG TPA: hypothetical protein VH280_17890 [Verrucomicrobiae bacterium]|jgi:hypothetical protein|nr:hypothetical protein [Verrucomicrobiae bacterium]
MYKNFLFSFFTVFLTVFSASAAVQYVETMPPGRAPEITYWFWQTNTLVNAHYLDDVRNMATNSPYTIALMTERDNLDFYDYKAMHKPFAETVREAHKHGVKIGLQLWEYWTGYKIRASQRGPDYHSLPINQAAALVTEGEVVLDAAGHADYSVTCINSRRCQPFHSEVLKVFAFRKTEDGYYAPHTLTDITARATTVKTDAGTITLAINAPARLAGYTAHIMCVHYCDFPDLFNDVMIDKYREALEQYSDIPFDGTALDEFGSLMVTLHNGEPFRDRFYGYAFAAAFKKQTGMPLERALFDMRFAPEGKPEVRIRAINEYFDVFRQGPLRVEQAFYRMSKQIFGTNTFAGIHNTFHNSTRTDDVWRCGFNWWSIPREYGQSDENWPMPQCMGLAVVHPEPITIDQLYSHSMNAFIQKAFRDAPFDGRVDYHGWNDYTNQWGIDLAQTTRYAPITDAELKIRLLNQFDPAAPRLSVLVVFGMPALVNWFPDESARSPWDINGKLEIEGKAKAIWSADYPCALLPSDFIDNGQITFDAAHHPVVNGHRFDALVFLDPQYAKETTLKFLERYTKAGGPLMLEGTATRDFRGRDVTSRFQKIADRATVLGFDVAQLPKLGAHTNSLSDGAFLEDGSVVFSDYKSWHEHRAKPFTVELNGHEYSGSYVGVCALKANTNGNIEKLACGGFKELKRDGQMVFSLDRPADIVVRRTTEGDYDAIVVGPKANYFEVTKR